jgi:hypothetical protein
VLRGSIKWDSYMDPTSFVLDFLRNGIRRFRTWFETSTEDSREFVENGGATPRPKAKLKYAGAILPLLGIGLLSAVAFFRGPGSTGVVTAEERGTQMLTCHYMTVSLLREGKLGAESGAARETANVRCTETMLETSSLCRDKCTSWAPWQPLPTPVGTSA